MAAGFKRDFGVARLTGKRAESEPQFGKRSSTFSSTARRGDLKRATWECVD
jgi:hypothetical protein